MYKLSDFQHINTSHSSHTKPHKHGFVEKVKTEWTAINNSPNVFRYKIDNLLEKYVGKFVLMLNTDRGSNRRTPQHIVSIKQPFDDTRFNFTKISQKEVLFTIDFQGDEHTILVNVSPINQYHNLLCPSLKKKQPQVATEESLVLAVQIMFLESNRELKIVFNSLCALASVNHLHYHIMFHNKTWPVELVKWKQIRGPLHRIQDYPVDAFCFLVRMESVTEHVAHIYKLVQYLLDNSIAHNIVMTIKEDCVSVFIYPRKSVAGVKEFGDFNVAALELSGWITVYSPEAYANLQASDLEAELKKWNLDDFEELCAKVQELY